MNINIPEQLNCAKCPFCYEPCGICSLMETLHGSINFAAEWANKGWQDENIKECRPDWCPFKTNNRE